MEKEVHYFENNEEGIEPETPGLKERGKPLGFTSTSLILLLEIFSRAIGSERKVFEEGGS